MLLVRVRETFWCYYWKQLKLVFIKNKNKIAAWLVVQETMNVY